MFKIIIKHLGVGQITAAFDLLLANVLYEMNVLVCILNTFRTEYTNFQTKNYR